ncbi:hypothetical protein KKF91_15165 [Myxococcota bacterium]|nr:hypothetical protein [Myxococcota bacterium]MBU1431880.1 hypothetical protein [Myxococcota bacterium]MBU1899502.1 hypothetical protein [Myxococcota bacterium]
MRNLLLILYALHGLAYASAPSPAGDAPPRREVEVGVTLVGRVVGSFLTEPSDKTFERNGARYLMPYPGFGGVSGGGGLSLQAMWRGFVGLDWGLIYQLDQGSGEINNIDITLKQTALHMPLYLRLEAPLESVRPFAFFGPVWIFPGEPEVDAEATSPTFKGYAEDYMAWGFGFGFSFIIPVEGVDVRVPLRFAGAYNPNVSDDISGRMRDLEPNTTQYTYVTEWSWHATASLGLAWYFL